MYVYIEVRVRERNRARNDDEIPSEGQEREREKESCTRSGARKLKRSNIYLSSFFFSLADGSYVTDFSTFQVELLKVELVF